MRLMPSVTPVAMFERTLGMQHPPNRRDPRLAERERRLAHVCGHRLQPVARGRIHGGSASSDIIAPAAMNERPYTPPPSEVNENGASSDSWKSARPKMRDHDVGRAGDDLDARLDDPRKPARTAVLGNPNGAAQRQRQRQRDADHGQQDGADQRVEKASYLRLRAAAAGWLKTRSGRTYWMPR